MHPTTSSHPPFYVLLWLGLVLSVYNHLTVYGTNASILTTNDEISDLVYVTPFELIFHFLSFVYLKGLVLDIVDTIVS